MGPLLGVNGEAFLVADVLAVLEAEHVAVMEGMWRNHVDDFYLQVTNQLLVAPIGTRSRSNLGLVTNSSALHLDDDEATATTRCVALDTLRVLGVYLQVIDELFSDAVGCPRVTVK